MNPFLANSKVPIPFHALRPEQVVQATEKTIQRYEAIKSQIVESQPTDKAKRLWLRDELFDQLSGVLSPIYLLKETHPDETMRRACKDAVLKLMAQFNLLTLDEALYQSLAEFAETEPDLSPLEARFLKKTMDDYRRNGFRLDSQERETLKKLNDELEAKKVAFQTHIAESDAEITVTEAELNGLPQDFIDAHKRQDGSFVVTTRNPDFLSVLRSAHSQELRKKMYFAYYNRAREKNLALLDDIIKLRTRRADLLGFPSFAALHLDDSMAKQPETVWSFLRELESKVTPKAEADYQILKKFAGVEAIHPWDKLYYTQRYKEVHFELNEEVVKAYFPMNSVFEGMFHLAKELYGVEILERDLPVWHPSVRVFEVMEQGTLIGRFYLDLLPRANKYSHAACFDMRMGKQQYDEYQIPVSALVCNFSPPTDTKPSLLNHGEVETLFHEFGHLLHQLLTKAPLAELAGTNVDRDFVEMPSQIMENWVWEPEALRKFAHHYQTGEPIPHAIITKLLDSRHLNSGLDIQLQIFYATLDMTYHDGFEPNSPQDTTRVLMDLARKMILIPPGEGTHFQAAFGHLTGYAAAYYGYLWSRVYADDMFSRFKQGGLYSETVGRQFRQTILAKGNTEDPMGLIQSFLGRAPKMDAFLANIGL